MPLLRSVSRLALPRLLAGSLAIFPAAASADDFIATPLGSPSTFQIPIPGSPGRYEADRTIESSALEGIDDGRFLIVAHDKSVPLRLIETATARQAATLSSPRWPTETPKSSKWEAMAQDSEGNLYIVGSHSGKTEDERAQHRRLIRFRTVAGPDGLPAIDDASIVGWRLDAGLARALQGSGLSEEAAARRKIEGLTIREPRANPPRRELVVGLREPDDLVRAFVVDLTAPPVDGAELAPTLLFQFDPGSIQGVRRQLTSLEYVPAWQGFAVVTATEDEDNRFHGNTLWFVSDARIALDSRVAAEIAWEFEPASKAEGLAVLPNPTGPAGSVRFAIAFDDDAHVTGAAGRLWVVDILRRGR